MIARALAIAAFVVITGSSAAGWYRFVTAAGGTATSDGAAIAASTRASIGRANEDAPLLQVASGTTLTSPELAWLIATHIAAIQSNRGHVAVLGATIGAGIGHTEGADTAVAEAARPEVRPSDVSLVLALLLAGFRADPLDGLAFGDPHPQTSARQNAADLARFLDEAAQRLESANHLSMAEGAIAGSTGAALDNATLEQQLLAALADAHVDRPSLESSGDQSFAGLSMPSLAGAALLAAGLSRGDAAELAERVIALLKQDSSSEAAILGSGATTAQSVARPVSLNDMGAALMVAAHIDAAGSPASGYLLEQAASRLEMVASERNRIEHPVTGMIESADSASMADRSSAAAGHAQVQSIGVGVHAAQRISGLAGAGNARVGVSLTRHHGFTRPDRLSIIAGTITGASQRRIEQTRVYAEVEISSARHPHAMAAVVSAIKTRFTRAPSMEALGIAAIPQTAIRTSRMETQQLTEAVTFAVRTAAHIAVTTAADEAGLEAAEGAAAREDSLGTAGAQLPQARIVPPQTARSPTTQEEVLSVVWPTQPARLEVRRHGVTLNIPAGARSAVFQTRMTVESTAALEVPPAGEVLRVVRIEIFDALGRPVEDPSPERPLDLVIRLGADEIGRLERVGEDPRPRPDTVRLKRFDPGRPQTGEGPTTGVWLDIPLQEWTGDSVSASLDHLSLFALVASLRVAGEGESPDGSIVQVSRRRTPSLGGPLTGLIAAAVAIAAGMLAVSVSRRSAARLAGFLKRP
jgi:hypothetical protein